MLQVTLAGSYHTTFLSDELTGAVTSVAAYASPWALHLGGSESRRNMTDTTRARRGGRHERRCVRQLLSKLGGLLLTLFLASVVIFSAMLLTPGDPVSAIAGGVRPRPR